MDTASYIAFEGTRRLAAGGLAEVALAVKAALDRAGREPVVILDAVTSEPTDVDLRGSADDVRARLAAPAAEAPRGPGRPKLGVVAREVTLLPRHWDWLAAQPGGASVALRKLVEAARRDPDGKDRRRVALESAYRFLSAVAGDLPDFEEATRALFAGAAERFAIHTASWPMDVRDHARHLADAALAGPPR